MNSAFQRLPFYYIEISKLLFTEAPGAFGIDELREVCYMCVVASCVHVHC